MWGSSHLGRPRLTDELKAQVIELLGTGATKQKVSEELNIGVSTIYKIQREHKESWNAGIIRTRYE